MTKLYQVTTPYFTAAFISDTIIKQAAPILNWTKGKTPEKVIKYFKRKGYKVELVEDE